MLHKINALDIKISHLKMVVQVCVMKLFRVTVCSGGRQRIDHGNIRLDS